MSDIETFATIRGTAQRIQSMIEVASAGYHDTLYMRVADGEVNFLGSTNNRQVLSYCTFEDLKEVDGDAEAVVPTGIDSESKGWLDYLGIASPDGTVEISLQGVEDDGSDHPRLAQYWEAEGALNARIRLPGGADDLSKVPWQLPSRWTSSNEYVSRAGLNDDGEPKEDLAGHHTPTVTVETTTEVIRSSIIGPSDFMDGIEYFPFIVEDETYRIHLEGRDGDDAVWGEVNAEKVEGPDVSTIFEDGFKELFGVLSGPVRLQTWPTPEDRDIAPPLVVVQDNISGQTTRHILGPFVEE